MLILTGKTCTGKTTLAGNLVKLGMEKIVTYTTRPKREGEIDGVDYHFITELEFQKLKNEGFFAEDVSYDAAFGHCSYGSAKKDYDDPKGNKVIILNPFGLAKVQKANIDSLSILLSLPEDVIYDRLRARGDAREEAIRRVDADNRDFAGIRTDIVIDAQQDPETLASIVYNLVA